MPLSTLYSPRSCLLLPPALPPRPSESLVEYLLPSGGVFRLAMEGALTGAGVGDGPVGAVGVGPEYPQHFVESAMQAGL